MNYAIADFVFCPVDCADLQDRDKESFQSRCQEKGLYWNLIYWRCIRHKMNIIRGKVWCLSYIVVSFQNWKKFGNSEFDAPGPNVATTTVSDDVFMTFISSKEVSIHCGLWDVCADANLCEVLQVTHENAF